MEIGLLTIIEITYNISTLFLLSLIAYLLLKEKSAFGKLKPKIAFNKSNNKNKKNQMHALRNKENSTQLYNQKNNLTVGNPYELVNKLAKHGLTKREISKRLKLPRGEVELVLKFNA